MLRISSLMQLIIVAIYLRTWLQGFGFIKDCVVVLYVSVTFLCTANDTAYSES